MVSKEKLDKVGIDYQKGLTYFGQDENMYQKYLTDFAHEHYTEDAIERLKVDDIKETFDLVHKLKSLVEYICIPKIDEIVHEITETLRKGKKEGVMDGLMFIKTVSNDIKQIILEDEK